MDKNFYCLFINYIFYKYYTIFDKILIYRKYIIIFNVTSISISKLFITKHYLTQDQWFLCRHLFCPFLRQRDKITRSHPSVYYLFIRYKVITIDDTSFFYIPLSLTSNDKIYQSLPETLFHYKLVTELLTFRLGVPIDPSDIRPFSLHISGWLT